MTNNDNIKKLELRLKESNEFTVTKGEKPYSLIGTEERRKYSSEIGEIETYKLSDNGGKTEEFIVTSNVNIEEKKRQFYGQNVKTAIFFSPEQADKLTKIADDVL